MNPSQARTSTRAPAAAAISRVRSVECASTTSTSSQNRTLSRAAPTRDSSLSVIRTAEIGVTREQYTQACRRA